MQTWIGGGSEHANPGGFTVREAVESAKQARAELVAICDDSMYYLGELMAVATTEGIEVAVGLEYRMAGGTKLWLLARSADAIRTLFRCHNEPGRLPLESMVDQPIIAIVREVDQHRADLECRELAQAFGDRLVTATDARRARRTALTSGEVITELPGVEELLDTPLELPKVRRDAAAEAAELRRRVSEAGVPPHLADRVERELERICRLGVAAAFLRAHDIASLAHKERIVIGPGRGSAVGAALSYVLGITAVDPTRYGLLFDRFLPEGTKRLPDIDIDVSAARRNELLDKLAEGKDYTSLRCSTPARWSVRSYLTTRGGRLTEEERKVLERLANESGTLEQAVDELQKQLGAVATHDKLRQSLEQVYKNAGRIQGWQTHPSAVVFVPNGEVVPVVPTKADRTKKQLALSEPDLLGLVKIDLLSSAVLDACAAMRSQLNAEPPASYEDRAVYRALAAGSLQRVFQFNGEAGRRVLQAVQPSNFEELVACEALLRPGSSAGVEDYHAAKQHAVAGELATTGGDEEFVAAKRGKRHVNYVAVALKDILRPTYGVLIYDEQFLAAAWCYAKMPPAEAEQYRRAVARGDKQTTAHYGKRFVELARDQGRRDELTARVRSLLERSGGYTFARAHAVPYAMLSYESAYYEVHFPTQWHKAHQQHQSPKERAEALYSPRHDHELTVEHNMATHHAPLSLVSPLLRRS